MERDGQRLQLELADCEITISPSGTSEIVLMVENVTSEREWLRSQGISVDWPVELVDGIRKRSFVDVIDPDSYRVSIEQQTWLTELSHTE